MRVLTIVTLALLAVAIVVCAQQTAPNEQPIFHSDSSELVVLPVTVTDRHGQLVGDLSKDRFAVFDNGRRQDVNLFSSEDTPVTIGLVIDNSASMRPKMGEVIAAALAFARASNPDDELFALVFADDVRDALPQRSISTEDTPALQAALSAVVPDGRTALYDGLLAGLTRAANGARARKVLILVSDGGDNASRSTQSDVLARARAANVTIYTIGLFDRNDEDANPRLLKALAEATGGERFLPRSAGPLIGVCAHIAREIRSGYTIGYVPPDRDGAFHRVRVQVEADPGRKLIVRTRPGYFAAGVVSRRERSR
jgi:Ca-activated chloride channel homolog